jgi:hypothetical protein
MGVGHVAYAEAGLRVVCVDPHASELRARIEGQTRDLPIRLAWVDEQLPANIEAAQLQQLADRYPADLVVVVQPNAAGGLSVYVFEVRQRQLRVRDAPLPEGVERLANSTLAETAALIVRGELAAAIGARTPTPATAEQAVARPAGETPSAPRNDKPQPATAPPAAHGTDEPKLVGPAGGRVDRQFSQHGLVLAAGVRAGLPGSDALLWGPWLGAHLAVSWFELGLVASTTLPADLQRDTVGIAVRRHALAAEVRGRLAVTDSLELAVGLEAGFAAYARKTRLQTNAELTTTPDATSWSVALGPLAELRWRFLPRVGLAARLGVDINPQPTRFVYRQAGERLALAELAVFEPWAAAALFVDIWK